MIAYVCDDETICHIDEHGYGARFAHKIAGFVVLTIHLTVFGS